MADSTELSITTSSSEGAATLRLRGEIDLTTRPVLDAALEEALGSGARRIVLEASELTFMDSAGVAALVAAVGRGAEVAVVDPPPIVRRVLEIIVVDGLIIEP